MTRLLTLLVAFLPSLTVLCVEEEECSLNDGETSCANGTQLSASDDGANDLNVDPSDPDFDILHFDASQYDYGEFPCPGLEAGWTCDYTTDFSSRNGDHFFCDADVIQPDMSVEEFNSKYLFRKPVLINTTIEDWANTSFWSRKALVDNYGDFLFEAGRSLELVLNSGIGSIAITLRDWLRDPMSLHLDEDVSGPYDGPFKEPLYIFDRSIWNEERGFKDKHFHAPPFLANGDPEYGILFLGPTGTGATWHGHGETWAAEAYGRKRWFLYPPEISPPGGFWPGYSAKDWYYNVYPHLYHDINMSNNLTFNDKQEYYRESVFERRHSNNETKIISDYEDIFMTDNTELNGIGDSRLYKPIECIQAEGQLLYLPEFWFHAVLNLGDVVAAGIQTSRSYTAWMQEIDRLGNMEKEMNYEGQRAIHKQPLTDLEHEIRQFKLLQLYQRLEEMSPNNAVRPFMVGHNLDELGYHDQAKDKMTEALKMDPAFVEAYTNLGRLYLDESGPTQRRKGEHLWRIAYMLNPNNPKVRDNLMRLFRGDGRDELAEMVNKHEKLPPMADPKQRKRERTLQQQEARRKLKEAMAKGKEGKETKDQDQEVSTPGQEAKTIPEPTEAMMENRLKELENEPPPELVGMANSII